MVMVVATLQLWQSEMDEPVREFEKEFASEKSMRQWLAAQEGHPFLFYVLIGFTNA